jgi:ubiquinone/menaquinone biosynthesis C-methylase UbiE
MRVMGVRKVLIVAGLTTAAVAVGRRVIAHGANVGAQGSACGVVHGGWATCSAPSARVYDVTFGWLLRGLYRRMADDLAAAVAGIAEPDVLEIGPGPGGLAVELARRAASMRLTGVDIDPAMVDRAALRARREGLDGRLAFVVGDVAALPFPDASFDLVTSSFSVHHWPDAATGFAEIRRVLRPGGRAIVYDLSDRWGHLERKAPPLAKAAALGGFAGARTQPFRWPGPVGVTNRLELVREAEPPPT